jgi:hypothetical protein
MGEKMTEFEHLLDRSGIKPEDIDSIDRMNVWEGFIKTADGTIEKTQLHSIQVTPHNEAADLHFLTEASPTRIMPSRATRRSRTDQVLVDIPDIQFGYRRLPDGTMIPTHSPEAMDVALQITKDIQPDLIILGGDELDLPELSRFPDDSRHFVDSLQLSIDGLHNYLSQLRADNPNARIVNLDSNHVKRIGNYMLKNAFPLFGVRPANMPRGHAAISYENLMRLDELDIEFDSGYPATEFQVNDRLSAVHGDKAVSRGSTASRYLPLLEDSLLFHHTHREESLTRTTKSGKQIQAFSFGSLCNTTGAVPGANNAVRSDNTVVPHQENWTNGVGIVHYREGDHAFQQQPVRIDHTNGFEAVLNGKVYTPNGTVK